MALAWGLSQPRLCGGSGRWRKGGSRGGGGCYTCLFRTYGQARNGGRVGLVKVAVEAGKVLVFYAVRLVSRKAS